MTTVSNDFLGLAPVGTTITAGNSGGASGTAFDAVTLPAGATMVSDTTAVPAGLCLAVSSPAASPTTTAVSWTSATLGASPARVWARVIAQVPNLTQSSFRLVNFLSGSTLCAAVQVLTGTGKIRLLDSAGGTIWTSSAGVTAGKPFRVAAYLSGDAGTAGAAGIRVWFGADLDRAAPTEDSGDLTGLSSTVGLANQIRVGVNGTTTASVKLGEAGASNTDWVSNVPASLAATAGRLRCGGSGRLVDTNGYVQPFLKGFCLPVYPASDPRWGAGGGPWASGDYTGMWGKGARLLRVMVMWDQLQPAKGSTGSPGDYSGIDTTWVTGYLDHVIADAAAQGFTMWLGFYMGPAGGHIPSWAITAGTESDPDNMANYLANGQNATTYLAKRYGDPTDAAGKFCPAVIGMGINEASPRDTTSAGWLPAHFADQVQMATWMRASAPHWVLSLSSSWGAAAVYPNAPGSGHAVGEQPGNGDQTFTTTATPTTNFWVDHHNYAWCHTDTAHPDWDGRNALGHEGSLIKQRQDFPANGYPPIVTPTVDAAGGTRLTSDVLRRMGAAYLANFIAYCAPAYANCPLMIGEYGWDPTISTTGQTANAQDKAAIWAAATPPVVGVTEWTYGVVQDYAPAGDRLAARPGTTAPHNLGADGDGWLRWANEWFGGPTVAATVANTFTAVPAGAAPTALNTGGPSGAAFNDLVTGTGATVAGSADPLNRWPTLLFTSGTTGSWAGWDSAVLGTDPARVYARMVLSVGALTSTARLANLLRGTTLCAGITVVATTGQVRLVNSAAAEIWTSTAGVTASQPFRVEWYLTGAVDAGGAGTAQAQVRVWFGPDLAKATPDEDSGALTSVANTGLRSTTGLANHARFGTPGTTAGVTARYRAVGASTENWVSAVPAARPGATGTAGTAGQLECAGQRLADINGCPLPVMRGFCAQIYASSGPWTRGDFDAMYAKGARIVRLIIHWYRAEPNGPAGRGVNDYSGISQTWFTSLVDPAVKAATDAGLYVWFGFYQGPSAGGVTPAWAQTYSSVNPDAMGNFTANGRNVTEYLAKRYGCPADPFGAGQYNPAVIGMGINEPDPDPAKTDSGAGWLNSHFANQVVMADWMRNWAPRWIFSLSSSFGSGAFYANATGSGHGAGEYHAGDQTFTTGIKDPTTNFWIDHHNYNWIHTDTAHPVWDGKNATGQNQSTSKQRGDFTTAPDDGYPPSGPQVGLPAGTGLDSATIITMGTAYLANMIAYCAPAWANCPLMIGEVGWDPTLNNHGAALHVADKNVIWAAATPPIVAIEQWDYGLNQTTDPMGARPGVGAQGQIDPDGWQTWTNAFMGAAGPPLVITTASVTNGTYGQAYSATLAATGGTTPYTWSVAAGALPAGLSLGSGTGAITGTPTATGTYNFTARVTDSSVPALTDDQVLSLTVPALAVTTTSLPGGTVGVAYSQTVQATGGAGSGRTFTVAAGLPPGLSIASGGTISGTPTGSGGTYPFTVVCTDASGSASRDLSIQVTASSTLAVTTSSLPGGTAGAPYTAALAASGGLQPYTAWAVTAGALPSGLSLDSGTGAITGTPTVTGTFGFTVRVTDSNAATATAGLSIPVAAPVTPQGDSLVIAGRFELMGAAISDHPACPGAIFRLGKLGGGMDYDLGMPQPVTDITQALSLDGERPTGTGRASNRQGTLAILIFGTDRDNLAAARETFLRAVDAEEWTLTWARSGGEPMILDCFRATVTSEYSVIKDKQLLSFLQITFPALPYGRSDRMETVPFPAPAAGFPKPPDPVVLDTFSAVNTSSQADQWSWSALTAGGGAGAVRWSRQWRSCAVYTHPLPPAGVNITGLTKVTFWLGLASTEYHAWHEGRVTADLTLADTSGQTVRLEATVRVAAAGVLSEPKWNEISMTVPETTVFDFAHVASYVLKVFSHTDHGGAGRVLHADCWLAALTARPPAYVAVSATRGQVYRMHRVLGSARAPINVELQPGLATWSQQVTQQATSGSSSFTIPAGTGTVKAEAWAGGGGGGGGNHDARGGGGGAGGEYSCDPALPVTGTTVAYSVGAAGSAGALHGDGGKGGDSTVTGTGRAVRAHGGPGGYRGESTSTLGARGGTGSVDPVHFDGGDGGAPAGGGRLSANGGGGGSSAGQFGAGNDGRPGGYGDEASTGGAAPAGGGPGGTGGSHGNPGHAPSSGPGGGGGGGDDDAAGGAGYAGKVKITYGVTGTSFSGLVVHQPGPGAPDTLNPLVPLGGPLATPNGTTEYLVGDVAGLKARFAGTYAVVVGVLNWHSPGTSRTVTVTVRQYDYPGAAPVTASVSRSLTPQTDLPANGLLARLDGWLRLPLRDLAADQASAYYAVTIASGDPLDRFNDCLLLDAEGSTVIIDSEDAYSSIWIDEPRPGRALGAVLGSNGGRDTASSLLGPCTTVSGPPLAAVPGASWLLAYSPLTAPGLIVSYAPRWRIDRLV